jgi:hypothetical protein
MTQLRFFFKTVGGMALLGLGAAAWAQTDCVKDANGAITSTSTCYVQPDEYYLTIYKMGLCTAQPAPSLATAADFSSCTTVFESTTGSRIKVIKGTSSALTGTMTRPPNGSYTYGYVIAEPQIEIKTQHTFSTSRIAAGATGHPSGTTCWSTLGTAYVYSNSPSAPATCGSTVSGNDVTTQKMNSFSPAGASSNATFSTTAGNVSAYLVDATMKQSAGANNSMGSITRLLGVAPLAVTVSASTTGMNSSFKVSQGSTVAMCDSSNAYCGPPPAPAGSIIYFGGGPFAVLMTLQ